jgi:hypothetical protein
MTSKFECLHCGELQVKKHPGKFCSNRCQHLYHCHKKVADGTASARTVKLYLTNRRYQCAKCGINSWNGQRLTLELEHIDGNSDNNQLDNVCLLCSNCHSQTPTYKAKNKGKGRHARKQRYRDGKSY